jgi:hypothetical protein
VDGNEDTPTHEPTVLEKRLSMKTRKGEKKGKKKKGNLGKYRMEKMNG